MTYTPPAPLRPFQHEVWEQTREHVTWALFLQQRLGKTVIACNTAGWLYDQGQIDTLIVITKNGGVHRQWIDEECPIHLGVPWQGHAWRTGKAPKRTEARMKELLAHKGLVVLTCAVSAVLVKTCYQWLEKFIKQRQCLLVVDESTIISHPSAQQTRRVWRLGGHAKYRRVLTGTPALESPFQYYGQFRFLHWKILGYATYSAFKADYGNFHPLHLRDRTVQVLDERNPYKNLEELQRRAAIRSTVLTRAQVLPQLPPKLWDTAHFELSPRQRQLYDQMEQEYLAELGGDIILYGELPITRRLRLQQIACGYLPVAGEPTRLIDPEENPRLQALLEQIGQSTDQGIIWARFQFDLALICQALGPNAVRYDGTVSEDQQDRAKQRWKAGEVQWFVANPAVAGAGLTLPQAQQMYFYSNYDGAEMRDQAEDRAMHIERTLPLTIVDLLAQDTVDHHIVANLNKKFQRAGVSRGQAA